MNKVESDALEKYFLNIRKPVMRAGVYTPPVIATSPLHSRPSSFNSKCCSIKLFPVLFYVFVTDVPRGSQDLQRTESNSITDKYKLRPIQLSFSQKVYLYLQISALIVYDMIFERSKVMFTGGVFTQQVIISVIT